MGWGKSGTTPTLASRPLLHATICMSVINVFRIPNRLCKKIIGRR